MNNYCVRHVYSVYDLQSVLNELDDQGFMIREIFEPPAANTGPAVYTIIAQRYTVTTEQRPAKTEITATKALKKPKAK